MKLDELIDIVKGDTFRNSQNILHDLEYWVLILRLF